MGQNLVRVLTCLAVISLALLDDDDALYSTDISVRLKFHTAGIKVVRGLTLPKPKLIKWGRWKEWKPGREGSGLDGANSGFLLLFTNPCEGPREDCI